jgi:hypothetical protein
MAQRGDCKVTLPLRGPMFVHTVAEVEPGW